MSDPTLLPRTPMVPPCPECQQGKHPNCDGTTWNPGTDQIDTCPCHAAGHPKEHHG